MYGTSAFEFSFSKKDIAVAFGQTKQLDIDGEKVNIDPQLLFQRLLAIGNAHTDDNDLEQFLQYELSTHQTVLFDKYGMIRKATKSQLADAIGQRYQNQGSETLIAVAQQFPVFDGGSLLHRIQWKKDTLFDSICTKYVDLVKQSSGPVVVFHGYLQGPSTKDGTHQRRTKGLVGAKVSGFTGNKKENFLSNEINKCNYTNLMKQHFASNGIGTKQATGDADFIIAETGVQLAAISQTCVVGEDTDLLAMLCHHANRLKIPPGQFFFKTERKNAKHSLWDIDHVCGVLGEGTCSSLPFIHAIAGCDTTSRLFGIGKATPLKKMDSRIFREQAAVFCATDLPCTSEITEAGEKAVVCLYGGKSGENLNALRVRKFKEKVVTGTTAIDVKTLPPTSDAAMYHFLRVFLQVRTWMGDGEDMNPTECGWEVRNSALHPKKMDAPVAPQHLLKVIRWNVLPKSVLVAVLDCNVRMLVDIAMGRPAQTRQAQ